MLKIQTDNIYLRLLAESDMPIIATAMTGVFASDALPTETDQKYFFLQSKCAKQHIPNHRNSFRRYKDRTFQLGYLPKV